VEGDIEIPGIKPPLQDSWGRNPSAGKEHSGRCKRRKQASVNASDKEQPAKGRIRFLYLGQASEKEEKGDNDPQAMIRDGKGSF